MLSSDLSKLLSVADFQLEAQARLPPHVWHYYQYSDTLGQTFRDNLLAFQRYRFVPRFLIDVSAVSTTTRVLGLPATAPIGISPSGMQCLSHPDAELASARAAKAAGLPLILSIYTSYRIEQVTAMGADVWFQLKLFDDAELSVSLIDEAHRAGCKAVVVYIDTPVSGGSAPNFFGTLFDFYRFPYMKRVYGRPASRQTWRDLADIVKRSPLPVVLKGVLSPADARLAVEAGVTGILVSNHGGRVLDGKIATMDALSGVVQAVSDRCEVFIDGGVRTGSDVLKAFALGARAAFVGRPLLYGLACGGEAGATRVMEILKSELELAMGLSGVRSVSQVPAGLLVKQCSCKL